MSLDFTFILLVLMVSSGVIYIVDKIFFEKKRLELHKDALVSMSKKDKIKYYKANGLVAPILANQARSLFSVFLVVFVLRTFFLGNFLIPTASMTPTLPVGDFIFVDKTAYGIRAPFTNNVMINVGVPKRGDITVFHYPVNPKVDFVKRVIGLPGDKISYQNKRLMINGKSLEYTNCHGSVNHYNNSAELTGKDTVCTENLNGVMHQVDWIDSVYAQDFENIIVPEGSYFVMGDNRDNSEDSRYWGFVPEQDLVGKARLVWFSWDSISNEVRWNEIGKLF